MLQYCISVIVFVLFTVHLRMQIYKKNIYSLYKILGMTRNYLALPNAARLGGYRYLPFHDYHIWDPKSKKKLSSTKKNLFYSYERADKNTHENLYHFFQNWWFLGQGVDFKARP